MCCKYLLTVLLTSLSSCADSCELLWNMFLHRFSGPTVRKVSGAGHQFVCESMQKVLLELRSPFHKGWRREQRSRRGRVERPSCDELAALWCSSELGALGPRKEPARHPPRRCHLDLKEVAEPQWGSSLACAEHSKMSGHLSGDRQSYQGHSTLLGTVVLWGLAQWPLLFLLQYCDHLWSANLNRYFFCIWNTQKCTVFPPWIPKLIQKKC